MTCHWGFPLFTLMDIDQLDFFNVAELTPIVGSGDLRLSRFPAALEPHYLLPGGKVVSRFSQGCEIRFVPEGQAFVVRLSSPTGARVHFYQGDFWSGITDIAPGEHKEWSLEVKAGLAKQVESVRSQCVFSPEVVRLVVERGSLYFVGLDTYGMPCRKPRGDELPRLRWLAYGSSITQADTYGYAHQAALRLGVDVLNKGMSGSCGIEPSTTEYLARCHDWDFATLELGVNLRNNLDPAVFEERVETALAAFLAEGKPVQLITVFPNNSFIAPRDDEVRLRQEAFCDILRKLYEKNKAAHPQLGLIEGGDILRSYNWLTTDLVHPTHQGHSFMGEQLASRLRPVVQACLDETGDEPQS